MRNHRAWVAGSAVWLFLLFNIERLFETINLASFTYALATAAGVLPLLFRSARRELLGVTIAASEVVFVVAKCGLGYSISWETLPITFVEASALALTILLMARIGRNTDRFEESSNGLLKLDAGRSAPWLEDMWDDMDRELRRARRHERPISLLRLRVAADRLQGAVPNLFQQFEEDMIDSYTRGRVADLLAKESKADDVIAIDREGFLLLLPETTVECAEIVAERLRGRLAEEFGLNLVSSACGFPEQELTLAGMLEAVDRAHRPTWLLRSKIAPTSRAAEPYPVAETA